MGPRTTGVPRAYRQPIEWLFRLVTIPPQARKCSLNFGIACKLPGVSLSHAFLDVLDLPLLDVRIQSVIYQACKASAQKLFDRQHQPRLAARSLGRVLQRQSPAMRLGDLAA